MQKDFHRMTLRIPKELNEWISEQARSKHRSLTAEIVNMIRVAKEESEKELKAA